MPIQRAETGAYPIILDRPEAVDHVESNFSDDIRVLTEVIDYGTNLIPRCWSGSPKKLADVVILTILLKQCIGLVDAGQVLLTSGCVEPAWLQVRALFEASVYIDWILKRDTIRRSKAYYVANLRRRLQMARRWKRGTDEYRAFRRGIRSASGLMPRGVAAVADLKLEIGSLTSRLQRKDLCQMNSAFSRRARRFDPSWYAVVFPKKRPPKFPRLAQQTGRLLEYRMIYERGSETMHSTSGRAHVHLLPDKKVHIHSLRELGDFGLISQLLIGLALRTYRAVLGRYRPAEIENLARQYNRDWRAVLTTQKTVRYDYIEKTIAL